MSEGRRVDTPWIQPPTILRHNRQPRPRKMALTLSLANGLISSGAPPTRSTFNAEDAEHTHRSEGTRSGSRSAPCSARAFRVASQQHRARPRSRSSPAAPAPRRTRAAPQPRSLIAKTVLPQEEVCQPRARAQHLCQPLDRPRADGAAKVKVGQRLARP
eukprot:CAMPEP_0177722398 /NCGR_PEP_ID=MMETSP0484_2-20121128/17659_1 /TAXON_ID=354590 /ORGANISM="Rhodomonas lens, Strain RHODO" /LENGTH=158 /DNA_ID=CAMNT_0019234767 /DNA_START=19 /DNA_END=492 /DNA_ORIENTATION=-